MEIELPKLYDKQIDVVDAFEDPAHTVIVLVAGRQAGKTLLAMELAVCFCQQQGSNVMWVSPTDNQAQKVYKDLLNWFPPTKKRNRPGIKNCKGAKGDTEIVFINNSKIKFRSAGSGNALRGDTNHFVILDEAAFISEDVVLDVIKPTQTAAKNPKMLVISTPKGKNWLYEWYKKGLDFTQTYYKSFHFTSEDNPYANKTEIEQARQDYIDVKFRQEYLGEFVDSASVFKNIYECSTQPLLEYPDNNDRYYAGVDIGLVGDATVLSILNRGGHLVRYFKWDRKDSAEIERMIEDLNRIWKFKKILFESNGIGLPMYQNLSKKLTNIQDINTSSKSKPRMIERLIYAFENKLIRIINDNDLRAQLDAFNFKETGNGPKYFSTGSEHDDMVMSLVIARECWETSRYNSRYVGFY